MAQFSTVTEQFLAQYAKEDIKYAKLADIAKQIFEDNIKASTMKPPPICTARGKTPESLRRKLIARNNTANGGQGYRAMIDIHKDVSDLAGIRILVYFPDHCDEVNSIICAAFENVVPKPDSATYRARMYRVRVKTEDMRGLDIIEEANVVEVQVVSLMMHAWAEVEHRNYKGLVASSNKEKEVLDRLKDVALEGENVLGELYRLYNAGSKT
jgi:ppGpp synthetase/RelA/SpoT-type nucleotidyltranferase